MTQRIDSAQASIVICTRNRASQLERMLGTFATMNTSRLKEIVLVDNGSTDGTKDVLANFKAPKGVDVILVSEPQAGLGRARNVGWRTTTSDVIIFTDDDCYPHPNLIEEYLALFQERQETGCIGGRVRLYDTRDLPMTILDVEEPRRAVPGDFIPAGFILGANFAFRRHVLVQTAGFDERFGAGTPYPAEDIEMIARASLCGWIIEYDPKPVVDHHHQRRSEEDAKHLRSMYNRGRGAYYMKGVLNIQSRNIFLRGWIKSALSRSPMLTAIEIYYAAKYWLNR